MYYDVIILGKTQLINTFSFLKMDQAPLGNLKAPQLQYPGMDPTPKLRVCSFERVGRVELYTLNEIWRPF